MRALRALGIVCAVVLGAAQAARADTEDLVITAGVAAYLAAAPAIHLAQGERQDALWSAGLHVLSPVAGAAAAGVVAAFACPYSASPMAGLCPLGAMALVGLPVGLAAAPILDAALLGDGPAWPVLAADGAALAILAAGAFWPEGHGGGEPVLAVAPLSLPGTAPGTGLSLRVRF